ncbi:METTL21C, partial [Symbiodinium sp. KB8]
SSELCTAESCEATERRPRRTKRSRHILEGPAPESDGGGSWRLVLSEDTAATGAWSGNKVWPGALALLGHLHETFGRTLVGFRILELGAGLPLLSASLAALGAEVCATDHPDVIDQVQAAADGLIEGLTSLAKARLQFAGYAWGGAFSHLLPDRCKFSGPIDLVVGADLVYDGFPVDALYESLSNLLEQNGCSATLALQPRQFPMTAALREPRLIAGFLKRFLQERTWEVKTKSVGAQDLGIPEQSLLPDGEPAWKGLTLATIIPPGSRDPPLQSTPGEGTLRYQREALP